MDRNQADDLNDRMREERLREERLRASGLDRSGVPDSNASSESLVGDSMRADAPSADAPHVRRPEINPGDEIGEAVGGISGVLTGAALGSLGGPIGTIIGGIAGAVSGWWAGRAISEAASHATNDDDAYYRTHFDSAAGGATRSYDDVRPAYQLGHIAGRNPDYSSRSFDEVEHDLRHGWTSDVSQRHGQWDDVRDYARHAYERGRGATAGAAGMAGNVGAKVGNALDDTKDRIDGNPASRPGLDSTDSPYRAAGAGPIERTTGTVGGVVGGAAHTVGNTLDDVKDRIDGNPASRPGYDRTDDPSRAGMSGRSDTLGHTTDRVGDRVEHATDRGGDAVERAWDKTKDVAHRAADKVENAVDRAGDKLDDTKDRVDGNPASRPGVDRTDDVDRRF